MGDLLQHWPLFLQQKALLLVKIFKFAVSLPLRVILVLEELWKGKKNEILFHPQDSVIISVLTPVEFLYILLLILPSRLLEIFTPLTSLKWPLKMSVTRSSPINDWYLSPNGPILCHAAIQKDKCCSPLCASPACLQDSGWESCKCCSRGCVQVNESRIYSAECRAGLLVNTSGRKSHRAQASRFILLWSCYILLHDVYWNMSSVVFTSKSTAL